MMNDYLEIDMTKLKEIKCTRCGSESFKKGIIKKKYEGNDIYFEQLLKCKDCEHELLIQVRV